MIPDIVFYNVFHVFHKLSSTKAVNAILELYYLFVCVCVWWMIESWWCRGDGCKSCVRHLCCRRKCNGLVSVSFSKNPTSWMKTTLNSGRPREWGCANKCWDVHRFMCHYVCVYTIATNFFWYFSTVGSQAKNLETPTDGANSQTADLFIYLKVKLTSDI